MKIKIEPGTFLYRILLSFGVCMIRVWLFTLRVKVKDPLNINSPSYKDNCVVTMWHNRIMGVMPLFHKSFRVRVHAMASRSKDGQIISDVLAKYGIKSVRGSANKDGRSKGGAVALINCINTLKDGHIVCIIPDGPRGPKYEVQPGAIVMSAKSQVPILPISVNYKSYWEVKSWDRLQIPKPFSKVELVLGDLVQFEKSDMKGEALEDAKIKLRDALMDITVDCKDCQD
jgi:lysophospholipid acyltransferase (LPLAT)-like uncharacterized protein